MEQDLNYQSFDDLSKRIDEKFDISEDQKNTLFNEYIESVNDLSNSLDIVSDFDKSTNTLKVILENGGVPFYPESLENKQEVSDYLETMTKFENIIYDEKILKFSQSISKEDALEKFALNTVNYQSIEDNFFKELFNERVEHYNNELKNNEDFKQETTKNFKVHGKSKYLSYTEIKEYFDNITKYSFANNDIKKMQKQDHLSNDELFKKIDADLVNQLSIVNGEYQEYRESAKIENNKFKDQLDEARESMRDHVYDSKPYKYTAYYRDVDYEMYPLTENSFESLVNAHNKKTYDSIGEITLNLPDGDEKFFAKIGLTDNFTIKNGGEEASKYQFITKDAFIEKTDIEKIFKLITAEQPNLQEIKNAEISALRNAFNYGINNNLHIEKLRLAESMQPKNNLANDQIKQDTKQVNNLSKVFSQTLQTVRQKIQSNGQSQSKKQDNHRMKL